MEKGKNYGILLSVLAAALYAINIPLSKMLLQSMPSTLMAGFLYLGAGVAMLIVILIRKAAKSEKMEQRLTRAELPYTIAMIALDIIAPILLLYGLKSTSAATASLLNNFEIVATCVIAFAVFKEKISFRLLLGIIFIVISCAMLSFDNIKQFQFSYGSIFILLAAVAWGLENNCTRKISSKDPAEIVLLKGIFSGCGSIIIGLIIGERVTVLWSVFAVLGVGVLSYGMSIMLYVYSQRLLGAARTSAYYAVSPFIGAALSFIIFREAPNYLFIIALILMIIGAFLSSSDTSIFKRKKGDDEIKE